MSSTSQPTTPKKTRPGNPASTPSINKLGSNPGYNKRITVTTMGTFIKEELGDSRLVEIDGLLEHIFPIQKLPLSVEKAMDHLARGKLLKGKPGKYTWTPDLAFLEEHDNIGTSETKLKDFLTKVSGILRVSCPGVTHSMRHWSSVATGRSLKEGPADRKPDIILSTEDDANIKNRHVQSVVQLKSYSDGVNKALDQLMDNAFNAFSTQPTRRFFVGATFCAYNLRTYYFDRSGMIGSKVVDIRQSPQHLVHMLIGLTLCPLNMIGYDLTITDGNGYKLVDVAGKKYRLLKCVFVSETIRGRGTVCWRAVLDSAPDGLQYAIKDTWSDTSRKTEKDILTSLKGISGIPTLVAAEKITGNDDEMDSTEYIRTIVPSAVIANRSIEVRQFWRLVTTPFADKLHDFSSKRELLSVFIDTIKAHQEMLEKNNLLHRDISVNNIMMYRPDRGTPNQGAGSAPTLRKGLLIDVDYAIDVEDKDRERAVGHRTGTVPFMAADVLTKVGHGPQHDLESFFYVLVWMCTFFVGPNNEPRQDVDPNNPKAKFATWTGLAGFIDYEDLAGRKFVAFLTRDITFEQMVLNVITPYFSDLKPCLSELRELFLDPKNPATHDAVTTILQRHMDALPAEEVWSSADDKKGYGVEEVTNDSAEEPKPRKKKAAPRPPKQPIMPRIHGMSTRSTPGSSNAAAPVAAPASTTGQRKSARLRSLASTQSGRD